MLSQTDIQSLTSKQFGGLVESYRLYDFQPGTELNLDPEGQIEMVFQLDGEFDQKSVSEEDWHRRPMNFIGGLHSRSFQVRSQTGGQLLSIRFRPHGARYFLKEPLDLLKNSVVDLSDLELKRGLPEMGTVGPDWRDELDHFLLELYRHQNPSPVDGALAILEKRQGCLRIEELHQGLHISASHLRKLFSAQVGMSPKEYARIQRVNQATRKLKQGGYSSLTTLSYDLGYFDQSHFIRDFKSVTGRSPRQYLAAG